MNKIKIIISVFALFFITGYARAETIWFSPLTAIPENSTGARSLVLGVNPYGDAIEVTATGPVDQNDNEGVVLGLTTQANKAIKGVQVCYGVVTGSPNT